MPGLPPAPSQGYMQLRRLCLRQRTRRWTVFASSSVPQMTFRRFSRRTPLRSLTHVYRFCTRALCLNSNPEGGALPDHRERGLYMPLIKAINKGGPAATSEPSIRLVFRVIKVRLWRSEGSGGSGGEVEEIKACRANADRGTSL